MKSTFDASLADNPFTSRRIRPGAIPFQFPTGLNAAALLARLARLGWRGAIVGPHGTGKSTLLAALMPELARAGREVRSISLRDRQRRLPREFLAGLKPIERRELRTIVIVDGYEQLSFWSSWRLLRQCCTNGAGLLISAHRQTALPTLFSTCPDFAVAERIVGRLLAGASGADAAAIGPTPIRREVLHRLWLNHRGNLRETLFDLYDAFERQRDDGCSNC